MLFIKLLSGAALLGSIAWFVTEPDYEPAIAVVTSLAALVAAFASSKKEHSTAGQTQAVTNGSIGIQAGGNVNVERITTIKEDQNAE